MTGQAITTFEERVKQKLHDVVADLIPPERYDEIVRAAIRQYEVDDLPREVKRQLSEKYVAIIREELSKPEWMPVWQNGVTAAGQTIKAMLIEAAPLMLASMMGGISQDVLSQFRNNLTNATGRYF